MLQKLREKTSGWIAAAILVLLIVPFAFFGVENYFTQQVATYVAKVNDKEIEHDEFRRRFDEFRGQMRQMMGDNFDSRQFESAENKRLVLDRLIDEELLRQAGEEAGVIVPAARLQKEIAAIPAFQSNGRFDPAQYRAILQAQGMTPRGFEDRLLRELSTQAVPAQLMETGFVTDDYVSRYLALRDQQRSFDYVVLPPPAAEQAGEITDAQLKEYFDAHADRYVSAETVALEYLEIDASKLEVPVSADESTLRQRFEENKSRYLQAEQRLASHLLVKVAANADAEAQKAAQAKAQSLAEQARAAGADFAALAKANSDDLGSKNSGGDLGWVEKGIMDPAFEAALFAQQVGSVSDPVKSSEGWHVIQLREIKAETGKPFEEVRAEIEREYLDGERERIYSEKAGKLVDLIYQDPTTLAKAAEELKLPVQRTESFGRSGGAGLAGHPDVLQAAFSDAQLREGTVSDPIELGPSHSVVVRAVDHVPSAPRKFEDVQAQVRSELLAERLAEKARAAAKAALARLDTGTALADIAKEHGVEVQKADKLGRNGASVDPAIVQRAFALARPSGEKPTVASAELTGGAHALIALTAVSDGDPAATDAAMRTALVEQLSRAFAGSEANAYVKALRQAAKVEVVEDRL